MADRIRAIGRLQASPSGTFRQLGAKRSATVLWKAIVKGDNAGVSLTLAKSSIRHQAHEAVGTAKGELKNEGTFSNDLDGLRRLLDRAHPDPGFLDDPVLRQAYRLALFDAAWNAAIGNGKLGIRLTIREGIESRHEAKAMIKANLRSYAGVGNWKSISDDIRARLDMSPGSGPGQAALMEVVADGANKRKEKAVTNLELFENYVRGGRHKRPLKLKQTVNMINGMLDGVFPGVPPELRVSMAQSRRQFEASVKRCVDQLPDLKKRILQPLGGAMTIDVIDPIRALATEPTKAAAPSE